MRDGTLLAARVWRPVGSESNPVPAILEYLPYRRRDGTAERDALTHPYFAGHGYASVRVDMRGSGNSEGVLLGEYLRQEQEDGLDVIAWLAAQPWCSGRVGMIGISWGGFNGLQMAALRPEALKAVISVCSTDDRYADDIHFMGGCLLLDKLTWGSTMFSLNTAPPDPEIVGQAWRDMWLRRLEESGLWIETWLRRQRRDEFYMPRFRVRGLVGDRVPGVRGRRLGRRLHQLRVPAARQSERAAQGADRAMGPQISAFRLPRPADRLPAGMSALVGQVAEGHRDRHHAGTDAAGVDGGTGAPEAALRRKARPLGGRSGLAGREHRPDGDAPGAGPPHRDRGEAVGIRRVDRLAADDGSRRGQVVSLLHVAGSAARPTCRNGRAGDIRLRAAARSDGDIGRRRGCADRRRRSAERAGSRHSVRGVSRRGGHPGHLRSLESHPSRQPLPSRAAGEWTSLPGSNRSQRHRPPLRARQPGAPGSFHRLLAARLAFAGGNVPHHPLRESRCLPCRCEPPTISIAP